jgi:ATP-dependent Lhr-like helicase
LLAAPTGSGKTLAAFLAVIDQLVRDGETFGLPDETRVLYISPLKALSNDIKANLEDPIAGIQQRLGPFSPLIVRTGVRTGDTPAAERARMRRQPPHILVTTPESVYILLTSASGREMLSTVRTVIVDELHAVAANKRGAHLGLSLERLDALCARPPNRVGISATQKPMSAMAEFLLGARNEEVEIVDAGHVRERDLGLEMPASPLQPVMATEVWSEVYDRLAELAGAHSTTLVFVNTRRLVERVARHLGERLGDDVVAAHHGSLAKGHRLCAEQRLKNGQLTVLVATASLELGIDIGDVDLVCQLGSPHAIATFLQRVGRSGHGVEALPKGRLFPLSRDDLVQCAALLQAVRSGELDQLVPAGAALDVLAQHVVAETAAREWQADELYSRFRRAHSYRSLSRTDFDTVIMMLAEGYSTRRGRQARFLHLDAVNGRLRGRRGARLLAMTNGGAIPDQFDYDVRLLPEDLQIGTLNEDFAFESLPGDIFQLGNTSYRVLKVDIGTVYVEDAGGAPPSIPFWFGEAPGRSCELSAAVSQLRETAADKLEHGVHALRDWLSTDMRLPAPAADQLADYLAAARLALECLPTRRRIVFERFFDELGDMHVVIHSPFGSRLNRAWGLALRKRFCRKFNFELQAAALEDTIVLSLGPTHSFALDEVARYLRPETVRDVLTQALLTAPVFPNRWRWVATTALAVRRFRNGRKVPPQFQRSDAEDLLAVIFPDQLACAENLAGEREVPEHPLVHQALADCLHELMDVAGLERLLAEMRDGAVEVVCRDLTGASPLAQEVINARAYAFLDDAPAEERRTRAIRNRHLLEPGEAARLARPEPAAVDTVCGEAWPVVRDVDELHDALALSGFFADDELEPGWRTWLASLESAGRARDLQAPGGARLWFAAEREPQLTAALGGEGEAAAGALVEVVRSRLETLGPVTPAALAQPMGLGRERIIYALQALEVEGFVIRGHFRHGPPADEEWCERRLLARIHRLTLRNLRRRVEPVAPADFMRFLFRRHGLAGDGDDGPAGLRASLDRLRGFAASAATWDQRLLPARLADYLPRNLEALLGGGQFTWFRPAPAGRVAARSMPVVLVPRSELAGWQTVFTGCDGGERQPGPLAQRVLDALAAGGAQFFDDLVHATGLPACRLQSSLSELVAGGWITGDGFAGLRGLVAGGAELEQAGRWSVVGSSRTREPDDAAELVAAALLDRYGVVFRALLQRESRHLPPWRDLVRVLRRLEARGEVRGGRFVSGFSGEQFALPGAVESLRRARKEDREREICVAGVDPLNLTGIVTPGERVPATGRNRVWYHGGVPVRAEVAGRQLSLAGPDDTAAWSSTGVPIRKPGPDPYRSRTAGAA